MNLRDDPKTTLGGLALGAATYSTSVGFDLPHNQDQWISFAISVLVAVLGALARDR